METGKKRKGPTPSNLKIDEDWGLAVEKALKKERPKEGWQEPEGRVSRKKKKKN